MMKKIVLAATVAAVAVSVASTPSFAKKMMKKETKCTPGTMSTGAPNSMGWGMVSSCGLDGKMYPMLMMCYTPSGMCPK